MIKVEYFITFKNNGEFCNSINSFKNLIQVNENFEFNENILVYKSLELKIDIKDGEISNQKFFDITFVLYDIERIEDLENALKKFKQIIHIANGVINTLWNDISFHYSQQAYPLIHEIENLMRKFITKFMLRKSGVDWVTTNLPKELKNKFRTQKSFDVLFETDFIQLTDFLFKTYPTENVERLFEIINNSDKVADLNMDELNKFVPTSNWDRFFKPYLEKDIEEGYLSKRWKKLYELRCKVAHNNIFTKTDLSNLKKNISEIKDIIIKATTDVDFIDADEETKTILFNNLFLELFDTTFGTDEDVIKGGEGLFGKDVNNPIPVNTIRGNKRYLNKIRTDKNEKIKYKRQGSTMSKIIEKPIDAYIIMNEKEEILDTFYISPYHQKDSEKAPSGYILNEE